MAYSTDADLEQYVPSILDHGVPAIIKNGVSTTTAAAIAVAASTFNLTSATGLQANDYLRLDDDSNVEVIQIDSVSTNTITPKSATPVRKNHGSGVKAVQVDSIGFSADHDEAKIDIDNIIEVKWFKPQARERYGRDVELLNDNLEFNASLMLNASTQLKKASIYWVLAEYVLPKLSKNTKEPDAWERMAKKFEERFQDEIGRVLSVGIDYDWDNSGAIDSDENKLPTGSFRIGRG